MKSLVYVAYVITFFAVLYLIVLKRRGQTPSVDTNYGIEDKNALGVAEQAVKNVDLREEFSKTYDFVDSFSTLQGYSEDYIQQIIQMLAKNNISADFIFVESGPSGMMSYTQRQGTFELYVQKGETEVAVEAIRNFMETNKV